ncbi:TPA: hypothetical protein HA278_00390 [Candidatus Woesearchaeota archaeon]|nr:hypothetical protein [Candidatus Woesearchaeota archaeon]|tara:strand:- start:408 stop:974 length:567 start_codon:yes stop_codon:yes gene_type:complete
MKQYITRNELSNARKVIQEYQEGRILHGTFFHAGRMLHLLSRDPFAVLDGVRTLEDHVGIPADPSTMGSYFIFRDSYIFNVRAAFDIPEHAVTVPLGPQLETEINANAFNAFRAAVYTEHEPLNSLQWLPVDSVQSMYVSDEILQSLQAYDWQQHEDQIARWKAVRFHRMDALATETRGAIVPNFALR